MSRPKLIITADDYGMSPQFNRGILEIARNGLITGISVMIKRKYIRSKELLALGVPLGLHLELEMSSPYREIASQIKRFQKRFGQLPAYLDGHQHQHLSSANIKHVVRVAKRFHLPVRSNLPGDRRVLKHTGVFTPDNFISWHPSRIPTLEEKMKGAVQFPISELVSHPGYYDMRCRYRYNTEREEELRFLQSPRFREFIRDFQLIGYIAILTPKS